MLTQQQALSVIQAEGQGDYFTVPFEDHWEDFLERSGLLELARPIGRSPQELTGKDIVTRE